MSDFICYLKDYLIRKVPIDIILFYFSPLPAVTSSPFLFFFTSTPLSREEAVVNTFNKHLLCHIYFNILNQHISTAPFFSQFYFSPSASDFFNSVTQQYNNVTIQHSLLRPQTLHPEEKSGFRFAHSVRKDSTGLATAALIAW